MSNIQNKMGNMCTVLSRCLSAITEIDSSNESEDR